MEEVLTEENVNAYFDQAASFLENTIKDDEKMMILLTSCEDENKDIVDDIQRRKEEADCLVRTAKGFLDSATIDKDTEKLADKGEGVLEEMQESFMRGDSANQIQDLRSKISEFNDNWEEGMKEHPKAKARLEKVSNIYRFQWLKKKKKDIVKDLHVVAEEKKPVPQRELPTPPVKAKPEKVTEVELPEKPKFEMIKPEAEIEALKMAAKKELPEVTAHTAQALASASITKEGTEIIKKAGPEGTKMVTEIVKETGKEGLEGGIEVVKGAGSGGGKQVVIVLLIILVLIIITIGIMITIAGGIWAVALILKRHPHAKGVARLYLIMYAISLNWIYVIYHAIRYGFRSLAT